MSEISYNNFHRFWKFHLKTKNYILSKLPSEAESLNNLGPLERYQLKYIIENNKHFLKIRSNKNVNVQIKYFYLSFGVINSLTKPEILEFQNSLENFKKSKDKNNIFIIILGIVNHWVNLY